MSPYVWKESRWVCFEMSEWNCWKNSSDIVSGNGGEGGIGEVYMRRGPVGGGKRGRRIGDDGE